MIPDSVKLREPVYFGSIVVALVSTQQKQKRMWSFDFVNHAFLTSTTGLV